MTLILEDPALPAIGDLKVEIAAIGVATLTTNGAYEGGRKLVPSRMFYPKPYPSSQRGTQRMLEAA